MLKASTLTPEPLVAIRRCALGAVRAIEVGPAEVENPLAGKQDPSGGRWHVHGRAPLLRRDLAGNLDGGLEADIGVPPHANRLPATSEVDGGEGGDVEEKAGLLIPVGVRGAVIFVGLVHFCDRAVSFMSLRTLSAYSFGTSIPERPAAKVKCLDQLWILGRTRTLSSAFIMEM